MVESSGRPLQAGFVTPMLSPAEGGAGPESAEVVRRGARVKPDPRVSVIVPAYKTAEFIGETLDSIFGQSYTDYEIIVVNDGCPDTVRLEAVLEPYQDRIVYARQANRGLAGARNTALRLAVGEFVALLDSDDLWEPDYLATQIGMMDEDPGIDVLYPDATLFGNRQVADEWSMTRSPSHGPVTFTSLVNQTCNVRVFVTARRDLLMRAGGFDETLRSSEDFDLWLRLVKMGGRITYHTRPLARYRVRPGSLSSDPVWMYQCIARVLEKAGTTLPLTPDEAAALETAKRRFAAQSRLAEGKRRFFQGDADGAIAAFREGNRFLRSAKIALVIAALRLAPRALLRLYELRDRYVFRASTKY